MARKKEPAFGDDMQNLRNLQHNAGVATYVRVFGSLIAGLMAGIWGVIGWIGFTYYVVAQALVSGLLWSKAGGRVGAYFPSRGSLMFGEVFGSTCLLTFILFWTLAHNIVHLF